MPHLLSYRTSYILECTVFGTAMLLTLNWCQQRAGRDAPWGRVRSLFVAPGATNATPTPTTQHESP
jgi:hypothetical protein